MRVAPAQFIVNSATCATPPPTRNDTTPRRRKIIGPYGRFRKRSDQQINATPRSVANRPVHRSTLQLRLRF
jgi:hypothetical protein